MSEFISPIRNVGPEEAELRQQWADATALAWYAATAAVRKEAQGRADALWLELAAYRLKPGGTDPGPQLTETGTE